LKETVMILIAGSERIVAGAQADPVRGQVRWSPLKSLWIGGHTLLALVFCPWLPSWSGAALFVATSAATLCFGHSVGMHRRLIHGSFQCPRWLEYVCVYLGTVVGMAGPLGMVRIHDMRDWAQRQVACHAFFRHARPLLTDAWWQLHCELVLDRPPAFRLEARLAADRFYAVLERSWMLQQLPWAVLFFVCGGWSWVVWGVCARVAVCVTGHWLVGHFAHREGEQTWIVEGAAAQGYDIRIAGLISMGESWHNNHHAFPGSARLGLLPGQVDLGWELIRLFAALGLADRVVTPDTLPYRPSLRRVTREPERDHTVRPAGHLATP
jgi:fatty-acid desaturase